MNLPGYDNWKLATPPDGIDDELHVRGLDAADEEADDWLLENEAVIRKMYNDCMSRMTHEYEATTRYDAERYEMDQRCPLSAAIEQLARVLRERNEKENAK